MTRSTSSAEVFKIEHYKNQKNDFLLDLETDRILHATAASTMASDKTATTSMAGNAIKLPKPDLFRTTSSISLDTAISSTFHCSEVSTSTAGTTPQHSRSGTRTDENKLSGLHNAAMDTLATTLREHLDLEGKKQRGTGLQIPRNATPSQMPAAKANRCDPWTLEYPAPSTPIDVEACLAKKRLYGTPYEKLQQARAKMSSSDRAAYDLKQANEQHARWDAWEQQQFESTIRNLTRKFGYAAAFNKAEKIKRPHTFQNMMGYWEEWDEKGGGYEVIPGRTEKFADEPPKSGRVDEEKARRERDLEEMLRQ